MTIYQLFFSLFINKKDKMRNKYAYSITEKWLQDNGFSYDELIIVDNIYDKIKILKDSYHIYILMICLGDKIMGVHIKIFMMISL